MKARLAAGETLFGTFLTLGSPLAAESLGLAGFDWLLVDLEHGGGHESQLLGQLLGATAAGVHALVRVESDVRGRTARALDLGVEGVMCPQVNSAEAAQTWARQLPKGDTRDAALKDYVESIAYWAPGKAAGTIELINDATKREEAVAITLRSWAEMDPASARTWIAGLTMSDEVKARLQSTLPAN